MPLYKDLSRLGRVAIWAGPITTIAVTPTISFDPINPVKLLAISTLGFASLFVLVHQVFKLRNVHPLKWLTVATAFFILQMILVFFFSGSNILQEFYGTSGRNTGFLAYFTLIILMITTAFGADRSNLDFFIKALLATGAISTAYGFFQFLGVDPANWLNPYSPVIGFLGNPDFQSAFLGIVSTVIVGLLLDSRTSKMFKTVMIINLLITLVVILETKAQQGILVTIIGVSSVIYLHIIQKRKRVASALVTAIGVMGGILVAFGSLNKGPLADKLYSDTITFRGDYWRAGWKMTVEYPFFGVGLDNYGDWYRRARTVEATIRRGPGVTSDTAHNVFLDFSSNGGVLWLSAYLLLIGLTLIAIFRLFTKNKSIDSKIIALIAAWVAFQAQSLISINQIGLAIWGWLLMGFIIGYGFNNESNEMAKTIAPPSKLSNKRPQTSPSFVILVFLGALTGLTIALPNFLSDVKFHSALKSQQVEPIIASARAWPQDSVRMARVVGVLRENQLNDQALKLARESVIRFPEFFGSWNELSQIPTATPEEKVQAKAQMKRLDPHNPDLK